MCGILAILGKQGTPSTDLRKKFLRLSKKQRHRGPDWNGICFQEYQSSSGAPMMNILCHERLAIVDPGTGAQPLYNETGTVALTVNGEIFNHQRLRKEELKKPHSFATNSDCEPIVYLYEEYGDEFVDKLDGDFAFVIADKQNHTFLAARDPIRVPNVRWLGC
jgi:asparagine synthase (glutamine-hydrolysing)